MIDNSTSFDDFPYDRELTRKDYDHISAMFDCTYSFGYRLEHLRKLRGMTQKQLGMACDFPESSASVRIRQYESDSYYPKEDILEKLASALSVPVETLLPAENVPFGEALMQMCHWAEEFGFISFNDIDGDDKISFSIENRFMHAAFDSWKKQKELLNNNKIDKGEYIEWLLDGRRAEMFYKHTNMPKDE